MLLFRLNEPKPVSHPDGLSTDRSGKHLPTSLTGRAQLEEQKQPVNLNKCPIFRCFPVLCRSIFTFSTLIIKGVERRGFQTESCCSLAVPSLNISVLESSYQCALIKHVLSVHWCDKTLARRAQGFQSRVAGLLLCVSRECQEWGTGTDPAMALGTAWGQPIPRAPQGCSGLSWALLSVLPAALMKHPRSLPC